MNEKIVSLVPLTEEEKCHIGKQYGLEYYPEIIVPPIPVTIPQNNNKKVVVLVSVLIASVCAVIGLVVYLVSGKNTSEYVNNDVVSAQAIEKNNSSEENHSINYTFSDNGTLIITGNGAIPNSFTRNIAGFNGSSIVIKNGITSIGNSAFEYCTNLTNVAIPDSVISVGEYAFFGCGNLTSVIIPDSVTFIGNGAFKVCNDLTTINVDSNNTEYSSVDGILFNKEQTKIICYPAGKTELSYTIPDSVISIESSAFGDCKNLTSVTIPNKVASIGEWAFSNCGSLKDIAISDSVSSIAKNAFGNLSSDLTIHCSAGSYAEKYAKENNIKYSTT